MRTISGPRNRVVLVLLGLLLLLGAAWLISASTPLAEQWPWAEDVLPHATSTVGHLATVHQAWLLPVGAVVAVLAALLGIALLISQVPSSPSTGALRVTDEQDHLLGTVQPEVIERALVDVAEQTAGVQSATVRVGGAASAPWVQAEVAVSEEAEAGWAAEAVRRRLAEDLATVLGTSPQRVDLLVRLRSGGAPSSARLDSPAREASVPA